MKAAASPHRHVLIVSVTGATVASLIARQQRKTADALDYSPPPAAARRRRPRCHAEVLRGGRRQSLERTRTNSPHLYAIRINQRSGAPTTAASLDDDSQRHDPDARRTGSPRVGSGTTCITFFNPTGSSTWRTTTSRRDDSGRRKHPDAADYLAWSKPSAEPSPWTANGSSSIATSKPGCMSNPRRRSRGRRWGESPHGVDPGRPEVGRDAHVQRSVGTGGTTSCDTSSGGAGWRTAHVRPRRGSSLPSQPSGGSGPRMRTDRSVPDDFMRAANPSRGRDRP